MHARATTDWRFDDLAETDPRRPDKTIGDATRPVQFGRQTACDRYHRSRSRLNTFGALCRSVFVFAGSSVFRGACCSRCVVSEFECECLCVCMCKHAQHVSWWLPLIRSVVSSDIPTRFVARNNNVDGYYHIECRIYSLFLL